MLPSKYEKKFGYIGFGELNSLSAFDFERSLTKYLSPKKESIGYIKDFGCSQFGELDNKSMEDFEKSFNIYFS